ncbi:homocitrate synthase [Mycolicibacterium flavescens]|uniref:Homocitrate synthase n=1 Tax=Mycolicibacterium flavescens TaxID=1776 RepID=A0A1E3RRI3_MYCFV|nr:homocitrate synthase [Mycolicibacterium flavescens]MCV7279831.1 homocitrate synthase [Mycolicibacterium flavescens]ODQ92454.1 homocitrate synthase [Mycolicibacterium flavescens]
MTISFAPESATTAALPSFAAHVDAPMPRGLRQEADAMPFDTFLAEYSPTTGPLRLGSWSCADGDRPANRLGPRHYQATLAIGDRICTTTAAAPGPVAALTAMLYDRGIGVEMIDFHQVHAGERIATFIHGSDGLRAEWAMGLDDDATQSALAAVIACANRLLAA